MKRWIFSFLLTFGVISGFERLPSAPYISGDTFRAYADFVIDETTQYLPSFTLPKGSTIFVKTDLLDFFFRRYHLRLVNPYILISHNSDDSAPQNWAFLLNDPKLLAWFGQNVTYQHPKLHPIPIGIANRYWGHGDIDTFKAIPLPAQKISLLYLNFRITHPERREVYTLFASAPFCTVASIVSLKGYLQELSQARFTLCPQGNGLDCHRTWEALYMRSIPIVRSSSLDSLYEGLPVLIVEKWEDVTQSLLEEMDKKMDERNYQLEKLTAEYWIKKIRAIQEEARR